MVCHSRPWILWSLSIIFWPKFVTRIQLKNYSPAVKFTVGIQDLALEYKKLTVNEEHNRINMSKEPGVLHQISKVLRSFPPLIFFDFPTTTRRHLAWLFLCVWALTGLMRHDRPGVHLQSNSLLVPAIISTWSQLACPWFIEGFVERTWCSLQQRPSRSGRLYIFGSHSKMHAPKWC